MSTFIKILAVTGVGALLLVGFLVVLGANPPDAAGAARLSGLSGAAEIAWFDVGGRPPRITARTDADAFEALGFAQTQSAAWTLLLWRQAAAGRLAEWYGPTALPADRLARQLGLRRGAAAATGTLSPETRARIEAFVRGVNAGMQTERMEHDPQVTLLGLRLEPFEVADVLAIERLMAWLATAPAPPPGTGRWPDLAALLAGDARLRAFLKVHGLERSRIWTYADSSAARLVATYVTGASVRPIFFDADLQVGPRARLGVFLIGTPFAVAGAERPTSPDSSATRAWAVYPSTATAWTPARGDSLTRRSERFVIEGGQESVQLVLQAPGGLFVRGPGRVQALRPRPRAVLAPDAAALVPDSATIVPGAAALARAPDTTFTPAEMAARLATLRQARRADSLWQADSARAAIPQALALGWSGLRSGSDADAWMALWDGGAPRFSLFTGAYLSSTGSALATPYAHGALLADSTWRPELLARLTSLDSLGPDPARDATSPVAAALNRRLVADVDTSKLDRSVEREAYQYARSWAGSYEPTSVGATLFDAWLAMEARRNRLSRTALAADTAFFASVRRTAAFKATVDSLQRRFGDNLPTWRWGEVVPNRRAFAGHSIPGLSLRAARRYAPLTLTAGGHPSTLAYGPESATAPTTTFTLDVPLGGSEAPRLLRFDYDPGRFLARDRLSEAIRPVAVRAEAPRFITRLSPR